MDGLEKKITVCFALLLKEKGVDIITGITKNIHG
jgi:hypothetical protein